MTIWRRSTLLEVGDVGAHRPLLVGASVDVVEELAGNTPPRQLPVIKHGRWSQTERAISSEAHGASLTEARNAQRQLHSGRVALAWRPVRVAWPRWCTRRSEAWSSRSSRPEWSRLRRFGQRRGLEVPGRDCPGGQQRDRACELGPRGRLDLEQQRSAHARPEPRRRQGRDRLAVRGRPHLPRHHRRIKRLHPGHPPRSGPISRARPLRGSSMDNG